MKVFIFTLFLFFHPAQAKTYKINTQHSFVNFEIDYMKVSKVKGAFEKFEGTYDLDQGNLKNVFFKIYTSSINTRDKKRDVHLKKKEFFNVRSFPTMEFIGDKVIYNNGKPVKILGQLRLKGIKRKITFDLKWHGVHKDAIDKKKYSIFIEATSKIKRSKFGFNWNRILDRGGWVVGDEVRIEIVLESNPIDLIPAFSRFYVKKNKNINEGALPYESFSSFSQNDIETSSNEIVFPDKNVKVGSKTNGAKTSILELIIAFILLALMTLFGYGLKVKLQKIFQGKMPSFLSELISDLFLFLFLFFTAWGLAPLMGYK